MPGPDAVSTFCFLVASGASLINLTDQYPWLVAPLGVAMLGSGLLLLVWERVVLVRTIGTYARALVVFLVYGLWIMVIGMTCSVLIWGVSFIPIVRDVIRLLGDTPLAGWTTAMAGGALHMLIVLFLVAPGVILTVSRQRWAYHDRGWLLSLLIPPRDLVGQLMRALLPRILLIVVLGLTIVGIPWAIRLLVCWFFAGHAVLIDGIAPRKAATTSASLVADRWWRVAVSIVVVTLVGTVIAPLAGPILMLTTDTPLIIINITTSLVYGATLPFAIVASTHLYQRLKPTTQVETTYR